MTSKQAFPQPPIQSTPVNDFPTVTHTNDDNEPITITHNNAHQEQGHNPPLGEIIIETLLSPTAQKADKLAAYNTWSTTYDTDMSLSNYKAPHTLAQTLLTTLFPPPTSTTTATTTTIKTPPLRILDAGGGTGLVAAAIHTLAQQSQHISTTRLHIVNVDNNRPMLNESVRLRPNVYTHTMLADLEETLPFPAASFDAFVACALFVTGHVCAPRVLPHLATCLCKGGFGFFTVCRESFVLEEVEYCSVLEECGFSVVKNVVAEFADDVEANFITVRKEA